MGCLERYFRNRLKVQILSNYLGIIGSLFFALQNLTTNWGGNFHDDGSLTDTVKANAYAGIAWDEQYLQVGSLLVAWMFYVLGAELQGNLSLGRYKRIMTWMVNVPVIAYMIGNMILSARRVADDVETSAAQGYNIGFGVAFIVLALACIVIYATDPEYADEPWFMLTECTLTDDKQQPRVNDAPKFHNNRFLPQFILHIFVIICLFYFVLVGFIHYGANVGWLLTDAYKAQPLAVKVWDIGGASVGMSAVPIILMFIGFEIQGDLPPSNFKPLAVFVGCLNIFCVSIFMYSTTWDACNRGVIISDVLALIIMLILTLWAIACVVCYGVLVPYSDALWLKVLADPREALHKPKSMRQVGTAAPAKPLEPQWQAKPVVVDAGYRHFDLAWQPLPKVLNHDVEYRVTLEQALQKDTNETPLQETVVVPGTQPHLHVDRFLGEPIDHSDKFMVTVDHRLLPGTAPGAGSWVVPPHRLPTPAQPMASPLPRGWGLQPQQTDARPHQVSASWNAVPRMAPADIEYRVNLARRAPDLESGEVRTLNTYTEQVVVPGNETSLNVKSFAGKQLRPGDELAMDVEFRRLADKHEPRGGWQHRSPMTPLRTTSDGLPPDWKMKPQQTDAGTRHVTAGWPAPPTTTPNDIDYLVEVSKDGATPEHIVLPGEQPTYTFRSFDAEQLQPGDELVMSTSFRHKRDAERQDGGWRHKSDPVVLRTAAGPPSGWRVPVTPGAATPTSVAAMWKAPAGCDPADGEYRVDLATTAASGEESKETIVIPATQTSINVQAVDGAPLGPRQEVTADVRYRHRKDADYRRGGWGYSSGPTVLSTLKRTPPGDWTVTPHATDVGENHIVAEWQEVPKLSPAETEYRVTVSNRDGQSEQYVVAGENTGFMIDEFDGNTLHAGQELLVNVDYRDVEEASLPDGGWKGHSGQVPMSTLADSVPADWRMKPRLSDAGTRHVSLEWDGPPGLEPVDIEYRARTKATPTSRPDEVVLPGEQCGLTINSVGGKALTPGTTVLADVEYRKLSEATARNEGWQRGSGYQEYSTLGDVAPVDWRVTPTATATGTDYVAVEWDAPPDANPDDLEYHVEITKPGADAPDVAVLPGNQTHLTLREVNRSPLHPLEQVVLNVSFRYKSDARDEDGGWLLQHASGPTPFRTSKPRPPADWVVRPRATDVGAHHVNVGWAPAPNSKPEDMEYLVRLTNPQGQVEEHIVTGEECSLDISKFRGTSLKPGDQLDVEVSYRDKDDAGKPDGGWTGASRPVQVATVSDNLPPDWRVPLRATEVGSRHLDLEWNQPPGTKSADLEYHVTLNGPEATTESCVLPGTATTMRLDQIGGRALQPGDTVRASAEYRHKSDAGEENGGWQRNSGEQTFRTYPALASWKVQPQVRNVTQTSAELAWSGPPVERPSDFEYHTIVSDGEHKDTGVTSDTSLVIDSFNGRPLKPGQSLAARVEARLKADSRDRDGGWGHESRSVAFQTDKPRPPADWTPRPRATDVGAHHVNVEWSPAPNTAPEDVEYLVRLTNPQGQVEEHVVPGDECRLGISKFRSRSLKPGDELDVEVSYRTKDGAGKSDGGWTGASRPVQVATVSDNLPPDWRVPVRATEIGSRHLDLEWGQPPGTAAAELEYHVTLSGPGGSNDSFVVPGTTTGMSMDKVRDRALEPDDAVRINVEYRHKSDAGEENGGWQRESGLQSFRTYPALASWKVRPQVRNVTQTSAELAWDDAPVERPSDFEYKVTVSDGKREDAIVTADTALTVDSFDGRGIVPGQQLTATIDARLKTDARDRDGGWGHTSRAVSFQTTKPKPKPKPTVPHDWRVSTRVVDASLCDIVIGWTSPPHVDLNEIEYCLRVAEVGSGDGDESKHDHPPEQYVLPGTQTQYFLDEFGGEPIIPGDAFSANVRWRYRKDAGARDGGWRGSSGFQAVQTQRMTAPAALLESRVPRIFLLESIMFKTNSDVISAGAKAIPEVAHIMHEHPDLTVGVEGHVNFGQKPASADRLSQKRAERVAQVLVQQGVSPQRLQPAGHGYSRPRFPRGSADAKKNRRVEFRVLPGSGLYERLAARAAKRRDVANRRVTPLARPGSMRTQSTRFREEVEA